MSVASFITGAPVARKTTAQRLAMTPFKSSLIFDTDALDLYVGDGSTAGGQAAPGSGKPITGVVHSVDNLTETINGTKLFTGLVSSALEFRLGNRSYTRVAQGDSGGGWAGGYNVNINGDISQHDSTGASGGIRFRNSGAIEFYSASSAAAGTPLVPKMLIDPTGGVSTGGGPISSPGPGTGLRNERFGAGAFVSNTTGSDNTAMGYSAMQANTTGSSNVALGTYALWANISGNTNTAVGYAALEHSSGDYNTAVGGGALTTNTTGTQNVAVGFSALINSTTGVCNVAVGPSALFGNTTGSENTAVGNGALSANTTGGNNTAIGSHADISKTVGGGSTALGAFASTGAYTGSTAIGAGATCTDHNQIMLGTTSNIVVVPGALWGAPVSGSNVAGSPLIIAGGRSTGDAAGGLVKIQVSPAGSTGTGVNGLADVVVVTNHTTSVTGIDNAFIVYPTVNGNSVYMQTNNGTIINNFGVGGPGGFLGTQTNHSLAIRTNNQTWITLTPDGKTMFWGVDLGATNNFFSASPIATMAVQNGGVVDGGSVFNVVLGNAVAGNAYILNSSGSCTGELLMSLYQIGPGNAVLQAVCNGLGDAKTIYQNYTAPGGNVWAVGLDQSDGNKFKVSHSSALGIEDCLTIDPAGSITTKTISFITTGTVNLPDTVNGYRDLGHLDFSSTIGGAFVEVTVTVQASGIVRTKTYAITSLYGVPGGWELARPIYDDVFGPNDDFAIDVNNTGAGMSCASVGLVWSPPRGSWQLFPSSHRPVQRSVGVRRLRRAPRRVPTVVFNSTETSWLPGKLNVDGKTTITGGITSPGSIPANANEAFGHQALVSNSSGSANTGVGFWALVVNTTGQQNTAVGYASLSSHVTGTGNTAVGVVADQLKTVGNLCTAIGVSTSTGAWSWSTAIGYNAVATSHHQIMLGTLADYVVAPGGIFGLDAVGANVAGNALVLAGGKSTGDAVGGFIRMKASPAGSTGTSVNGLVDVMVIDEKGEVYLNNNTGITFKDTGGVPRRALSMDSLNNVVVRNFAGSGDFYCGIGVNANTTGHVYIQASGANAVDIVPSGLMIIIKGITSPGGGGVSTNEAYGINALINNTTGNANTAVGCFALQHNTTGINNNAFGYAALQNNVSGNSNIAVGVLALTANVSGNNNIAIGYAALVANTSSNHTAIGHYALASQTTGTDNTAVGYLSLFSATTGVYNTAVGSTALQNLTTGNNNVAVGFGAAGSTTTAINMTAIGYAALSAATTACSYATAVGILADYTKTTGTHTTALGAMASTGTFTHSTALGAEAACTASNQIMLGTAAETVVIPGVLSSTGIISSDIEFRLGGYSFSRVATIGGDGSWAGGYNFDLNGGFPRYDSTGSVAGVWYSGVGIKWYSGASLPAHTAVPAVMLLDNTGKLRVNNTNPSACNATLEVTANSPSSYVLSLNDSTGTSVLQVLDDGNIIGNTVGITASSNLVLRQTGGAATFIDFTNAVNFRDTANGFATVFSVTGTGINTSVPIMAPTVSGANVAGTPLILAGGKSTGDAAGGSVRIQTAPAGSTGTGVNGLVDALTINSAGLVTVTKKLSLGGVELGAVKLDVFSSGPGTAAVIGAYGQNPGERILMVYSGTAVSGSVEVFHGEAVCTNDATLGIQQSGSGRAVMNATVLGVGDAISQWMVNSGQVWTAGLDQSDGSKFKISAYFALGANDCLTIDPGGTVYVSSEFYVQNGAIGTNQINFVNSVSNWSLYRPGGPSGADPLLYVRDNTHSNLLVMFAGGATADASSMSVNGLVLSNGGFTSPRGTSGQCIEAYGYRALLSITTGVNNVALGNGALLSLTTGNNNTAIGHATLSAAVAGMASNTAVGYFADGAKAAGDGCTAIGAAASTGGFTYSTAIGVIATATADHQIMLGTASEVVVVPGQLWGAPVSGANVIGNNLIIAGGRGTGDAPGGPVYIQVSQPGSTGTGVNGTINAMVVAPGPYVRIGTGVGSGTGVGLDVNTDLDTTISAVGSRYPKMQVIGGAVTVKMQALAGFGALIGTETNDYLEIRTNNLARATFTTDGHVNFGNVALGAIYNFLSYGSDTVVAIQGQGLVNGGALMGLALGNPVTGSAYAVNASGGTTGQLYIGIYQAGTGDASFYAATGSTGDCKTVYGNNAGGAWATGLDQSDGNKYKISQNSILGVNDYLTIDSSGTITCTGQITANGGIGMPPGIAIAYPHWLIYESGGSFSVRDTTYAVQAFFMLNSPTGYAQFNGDVLALGTTYANVKAAIGMLTPPRCTLEVVNGSINIVSGSDAVSTAAIVGPDCPLNSGASSTGTLTVASNDAMGVDKGGSITFGGRYIASNAAEAHWATIKGGKSIASSGDYGGYLAFGTRQYGMGNITERMRIIDVGFVGIGTPSPFTNVDIQGAGVSMGGTRFVNVLISQDADPRRGVIFGYDTSGQIGVIGANTYGAAASLAFYTYSGSSHIERMRITDAGFVGIGTPTPINGKLEIADGSIASIALTKTGATAGTARIYNDGSTHFVSSASGVTYYRAGTHYLCDVSSAVIYLSVDVSSIYPRLPITFLAADSTTAGMTQASIVPSWSDSTHTTRKGQLAFQVSDYTGTDKLGLYIGTDGTHALVTIPAYMNVSTDYDGTPAVDIVNTSTSGLGLRINVPNNSSGSSDILSLSAGGTTWAMIKTNGTMILGGPVVYPGMADAAIPNGGVAWSTDTPGTLKGRTPSGTLVSLN